MGQRIAVNGFSDDDELGMRCEICSSKGGEPRMLLILLSTSKMYGFSITHI